MTEGDAARGTAMVGDVDVDAVAEAVRSCAGVSDLAPGLPGSVATYLPGRRVVGIAVDEERVRIQVRMQWAASAPEVGARIRAAVRPHVGHRTIDIFVADVDDPPRRQRVHTGPPPRSRPHPPRRDVSDAPGPDTSPRQPRHAPR